MRKAAKLYALLGVLVVICIAAFAVSHHEEKKEEIRTSGEAIMEIAADTITNISWTNDSGTYSFTKADDSWSYDDDTAFPVDDSKVNDLLTQFESFKAAFSIENVEDYAQYGLDEPQYSISVTADGETYTLQLGDFSKMDEERYVSLGDGNAYLAEHDPMEEFDAVPDDLILNDTIPQFDTATEITFAGAENYTVVRNEEGTSICDDDVYFADEKPLDTSLVESLLSDIEGLDLTTYASYNVSDEELQTFGMAEPELTISLNYTTGEDDEAESGSFTLSVSRNPEEAAAYEEAQENDETLPTVTCYARLNDSQIVYTISQSDYNDLTAVSYDTLRHQKVFTADFDTVTSIEATLNGETYTFTCQEADEEDEDDESTWMYGDASFDVYSLRTALRSLTATEFTDDEATGQEEISVKLYLDNEDYPTFTLTLYRYNGTSCLAVVDDVPVAYVSRTQTVDIIEAVNEVTLGE